MDATEIAGLESELVEFLGEFDDCFGRSEPREHLRTYVSGQLSALQRKSVEPIALAADVPPRTLQRFLESIEWDEERLRDKSQQIVARDHADPDAIGVVDETGHPKKGIHTAGVKRQLETALLEVPSLTTLPDPVPGGVLLLLRDQAEINEDL